MPWLRRRRARSAPLKYPVPLLELAAAAAAAAPGLHAFRDMHAVTTLQAWRCSCDAVDNMAGSRLYNKEVCKQPAGVHLGRGQPLTHRPMWSHGRAKWVACAMHVWGNTATMRHMQPVLSTTAAATAGVCGRPPPPLPPAASPAHGCLFVAHTQHGPPLWKRPQQVQVGDAQQDRQPKLPQLLLVLLL